MYRYIHICIVLVHSKTYIHMYLYIYPCCGSCFLLLIQIKSPAPLAPCTSVRSTPRPFLDDSVAILCIYIYISYTYEYIYIHMYMYMRNSHFLWFQRLTYISAEVSRPQPRVRARRRQQSSGISAARSSWRWRKQKKQQLGQMEVSS